MTNNEGCEFCKNEFSDTVLKEYEYWKIQLFTNQYYLGRTLIKLKRHAVDLTELEKSEREELFGKVLPELEKSLDRLFEPDLYNQATLGNDCRHFHLHVIPRYSSERTFEGVRFKDENWNSHYKISSDKNLKEETFGKLKLAIRDEING